MSTGPQIVYIGAPEADASTFEARIRAEIPDIQLFATNDRAEAMHHLADAHGLIAHHFQFDEEMLARAPRLRWIQSLTTGTDAILKLNRLRDDVTVTSTRGMHGPQMSELVFLLMLALLRNFPKMQRNQAAAIWERWPQPLLWGKTVVIVGVGAIANTELAEGAGLRCDNGIWVDEYCRTSDPAVYAAGDCTNHPSLRFGRRVRLESVDNAFEQSKAAALNMLGRPTAHDRVPWFWSDQFDNKMLIVGLTHDHDSQVVRGDPRSRSFSVCYLKGRELQAVEAINHSKDYMAARKLIADRAAMDLARLADSAVALKDAV